MREHSESREADRLGPRPAASGPTAAFWDMDGTILGANVVSAYAYYALQSVKVRQKLGRTAQLVASLPLYWAMDKIDRRLFNESFYKSYAGFSEDRLHVIGQEVFEKVLRPSIFDGARSLIERSKAQGHSQVLVTGALDYITRPVAEHLGFDAFVANRLEIVDGRASGRLLEPFIAGANKALWVRRWAAERGIDLDHSFAYADSASDLPLLSVVGRPAAVNPDWRLRTTARSYTWPVLEFS